MRNLLLVLFMSLVLFASSGCSSAKDYEVHVLDSGKELRIHSMGVMHFTEGEPALMLKYFTDIPIDDIEGLRAEAEEIWPKFMHNVEKAKLAVGILSAQAPEEKIVGSVVTTNKAYSFIWLKQPDSTWKLHEKSETNES